ncbi:hypothetical protein PV797_19625 [Clostridiaceae bacterium M8S5]|nr:hypothetical protein PV797_19625 [Clostridiaceae bacterium M8S5]
MFVILSIVFLFTCLYLMVSGMVSLKNIDDECYKRKIFNNDLSLSSIKKLISLDSRMKILQSILLLSFYMLIMVYKRLLSKLIYVPLLISIIYVALFLISYIVLYIKIKKV